MVDVLAGTGHRPPRLGLDYSPAANKLLYEFVLKMLSREGAPRPDKVVSGVAQGFDQALAHASITLGIPLVAAVPFPSQESKWPLQARRRYDALLSRATIVVTSDRYSNQAFAVRDRYMVDAATRVVALHDGGAAKSGTGITMDYAKSVGKPVENWWGDWVAFRA